MGKYDVQVLTKEGACDDALFEKMAKKGDIVAEKITNMVDKVITVVGLATCRITTDDKDFKIYYIATPNGYISTGSEIFFNSISDYMSDCKTFKVKKVSTKKGSTFKAVPILGNADVEKPAVDDLPF